MSIVDLLQVYKSTIQRAVVESDLAETRKVETLTLHLIGSGVGWKRCRRNRHCSV